MQDEIQCPNCRSFHTKSDTQSQRLTGFAISALVLLAVIVLSLINPFSVLYAFVGFCSFVFCAGYAYRYFVVKTNYSKCKACNYKWGY